MTSDHECPVCAQPALFPGVDGVCDLCKPCEPPPPAPDVPSVDRESRARWLRVFGTVLP